MVLTCVSKLRVRVSDFVTIFFCVLIFRCDRPQKKPTRSLPEDERTVTKGSRLLHSNKDGNIDMMIKPSLKVACTAYDTPLLVQESLVESTQE